MVRTLTVLDCGRVVVNATMLRRIGGLLREQDRREDRHTEDVPILCIDVIIASDMLTSKLCSSKLCLGLEREEEIRCSPVVIYYQHIGPSISIIENVLVSWIYCFVFCFLDLCGKGRTRYQHEMDTSCGTKGHVL